MLQSCSSDSKEMNQKVRRTYKLLKPIAFLTVALLTPLYSSNVLKPNQGNSVYWYLEVTDEQSTHIEVTA